MSKTGKLNCAKIGLAELHFKNSHSNRLEIDDHYTMDPNEFDKLNLNLNQSKPDTSDKNTAQNQETLISPSFDQLEQFVNDAAKTTNFKKGDCYFNYFT